MKIVELLEYAYPEVDLISIKLLPQNKLVSVVSPRIAINISREEMLQLKIANMAIEIQSL